MRENSTSGKTKGAALLLRALLLLPGVSSPNLPDDKKNKKKDIKITIRSDIERGEAPLPGHFVVEVEAPPELDKYIYESSFEWRVMGSFVLENRFTGGNPADPNMRSNPMNPQEMMLRNSKHLIAKERRRAPRKKFKEGMEVKKTHEFDFEFKRAGTYYVTFRLRNGKYNSRQLKVVVRGDRTYDPVRDPY